MQQGIRVRSLGNCITAKENIVHYYMFNIGDYHSHTSHLQPLEDLAYRRILDRYYLNEGPLKGSSESVARALGLTSSESEVAYVLEEFFTQDDDGYWCQIRADREITKYQNHKKASSKGGKASGKARRGAASEGPLKAPATPLEPTINRKPLTINHKPKKDLKTLPSNPDGFDEFWLTYPKKVGKPEALKAWKKLKPSVQLTDQLISDIQNRVNRGAWCTGKGKQFIPGPAPYLNQRKWEDEIIPRPEFKPVIDYAHIGRTAVEL